MAEFPFTMVVEPLDFTDPTIMDAPVIPDPIAFGENSHRPAPLTQPIGSAGIAELLAAYADGSTKVPDVLTSLRNEISASRAGKEAVLCLAEGAEAAAEESEARWRAGTARPLEGIPFGIKDIIDVAGTRTTCGSHFTGNRIAKSDAHVVARLRAAGAIPMAMLATTEFACGATHNIRYGTVTNPWNPLRWAGGSSTGSGAAVSARLLPLALGTDTAGSIRVPSCWSGVTGLKPTRELVSRQGVSVLSWTLDHIGPLTRSAADIATALPWMTSSPDSDLAARCRSALERSDIRGLRIGIPRNWFTERCDSAVRDNWRAALATFEDMGCELVELPHLPIETSHHAGLTIIMSELASIHAARLERTEFLDQRVAGRIKAGLGASAVDYCQALQMRKRAREAFVAAMATIDLIIAPGVGSEAGLLEGLVADVDGNRYDLYEIAGKNTLIFNVIGFPALMLPSGLGRTGLPTGIQIVGKPGDDALCLKAGIAYQSVTAHHKNAPPAAAGAASAA